jgi:RNA polymerase sigma-70 factor, ECF subfamily
MSAELCTYTISGGRGTLIRVDADVRHLAARAREGDLEAFSVLVEDHWSRLVRFSRSVVGDADAEDCVQDAMIAAWKKIGTLEDPSAFSSWVLRITARRCFRRSRFLSRFLQWSVLGAHPEPADPGGTGAVDVENTLSHLAPRQRAVMHLTVIEGMSDSEIAESLRIRPASVRAHRRRAREALRTLLSTADSRVERLS